jgi:hypothetical protein
LSGSLIRWMERALLIVVSAARSGGGGECSDRAKARMKSLCQRQSGQPGIASITSQLHHPPSSSR